MQDPNNSHTRKLPWYQRALEMATLWKLSLQKPPQYTTKRNSLWKTISKTNDDHHHHRHNIPTTHATARKLRKSTSLRVATISSFTRVCLCAPISSYTEVFQADAVAPPRRSYSYPRSKTSLIHPPQEMIVRSTTAAAAATNARMSFEGRRIFRGKSLRDDVLMRRFVVEEEAMMMQARRRNEMEIIRRRSAMRRRKIGQSSLSRMVLAEEE